MGNKALRLVDKAEPEVRWDQYPRLEPGEYSAYCKAARWYFDPGYKKWVCLLLFDIRSENLFSKLGIVPMWFNGGKGSTPHVGRRSRYLPEWIRANGSSPSRKDRLSPSVFVKRMAKVKIDDTDGVLPYSVVRNIIEWNTGVQ